MENRYEDYRCRHKPTSCTYPHLPTDLLGPRSITVLDTFFYAKKSGTPLRPLFRLYTHQKKMNILLVGRFKHGSLERSYASAFKSLNLNVLHFDVDAYFSELRWWLRSRIAHRATINNLTARRLGCKRYNAKLLEVVNSARPSIVLVFNGFFILPETAHSIRSAGSKFILFHADNPLPGNYNFRPEVLPLSRACDHFFTWSRRLANCLSQRQVTKVAA
jgi:hypothetical protein